MKEEKLISVIVPVYKVEEYLKKCVDSIINQTYKNLEIILVDDGSPDNCPTICDEYKKIDSRIKVIHKKNGGLSSARNAGLDIAKGDLIAFVDSDDYIELDMYEKLVKNMEQYNSDIAICDFYYEENNKKSTKEYKTKNKSFSVKDKDKYDNLQNEYMRLTTYAWNKIYKKNVFKEIRYPEGKIYEDIYIICDLLDLAKSISYLIEPLYHYIIRNNGISNTFSLKQFDIIESFNQRIKSLNKKGYYDLAVGEENKKVSSIILCLTKMKLGKIENKEIYDKYYNDLVYTSSKLEWKKASRQTKLFKVFKNNYIRWNYIERKLYSIIQKIRHHN